MHKLKMKHGILFLSVILVFIILAGCAGNKNDASSGPSSAAPSASSDTGSNASNEPGEKELEPYDLTMVIPIFGTIPKDLGKIQDAVNKITQAKINTTVTVEMINIGNYLQQLNLKYSSGDKLDVAFIFGQLFANYTAQGRFQEIGDLVKEYGEGLTEAVGEKYVNVPTVNGKLYGLPIASISGSSTGYLMRKDIVDKYNIDLSSIKTYDDVDKILKIVKENEPTLIPLAESSGLNPVNVGSYGDFDSLTNFVVLPMDSTDYKVENRYATQIYADRVKMARKWFEAGYVNKDAATTNQLASDLVRDGKAFSYFARLVPTSIMDDSLKNGHEMVGVSLSPNYVTTEEVTTGLWTVAHQSEDPARAMMFLDLLYTDKDLANLLVFGIEGEDYVKVSDNIVTYPEGKDASTVGYNLQGSSWVLGNPKLLYLSENEDPTKWEKVQKWQEGAIPSRSLGFTFDEAAVKDEVTSINNALNQYQNGLETGTLNPDKELPKFLDKLKSAGIDKYLAEVQKQLDEWVAANK